MVIAFHGSANLPIKNLSNVGEVPAKASFKSNLFEGIQIENDSFKKAEAKDNNPPKLGFFRIAIGRLTKEQIEAINKTKSLPENAKFVESSTGKINIQNNIANVITGTQKLPVGYEVKNDILGFTHVVREGSKNIFMK